MAKLLTDDDRKFRFITPFTKNVSFQKAEPGDLYLGYVFGLAATNHKDRYGDIITDKALMKGALDLIENPTVFEDHNYDVSKAVGTVIESDFITKGAISGIKVKIGISKTATELWTKIEEGIIRSFSIGGIWLDYDYDEDKDVWLIKDMELWELSIVGVPANPGARFGTLGMTAMNFVKKLNAERNNKIKVKNTMPEEPEWLQNMKSVIDKYEEINQKEKDNKDQKIAELEAKLKALETQAPATKPDVKHAGKNSEVEELKSMMGKLVSAVEPVIKQHHYEVELAERKSIAIKQKREEHKNMNYAQRVKLGMQQIIQASLDPQVDEVVLLGELEFEPNIHKLSVENARDIERRATQIYR
jgi:HK97 family phage prohead protease